MHCVRNFSNLIKTFFLQSLSETGLAVTVTRSCVGVWELRVGHLLSKLADSHLGAIVTHAEITPDGKYIISSETGKLLIWNRVSEQVLFRDDQPGIQQVKFLENGEKVLSISCANINRKTEDAEGSDLIAVARVRNIPDGNLVCAFEFPIRMIPGIAFRNAVVTSDNNHIVVVTIDKTNKDCISVFNVSGNHVHKIALKGYNIKVSISRYCLRIKLSIFCDEIPGSIDHNSLAA